MTAMEDNIAIELTRARDEIEAAFGEARALLALLRSGLSADDPPARRDVTAALDMANGRLDAINRRYREFLLQLEHRRRRRHTSEHRGALH